GAALREALSWPDSIRLFAIAGLTEDANRRAETSCGYSRREAAISTGGAPHRTALPKPTRDRPAGRRCLPLGRATRHGAPYCAPSGLVELDAVAALSPWLGIRPQRSRAMST